MVKQRRPDDNALIDRMADEGTLPHQGSAGGDLARKVGSRGELNRARGDLVGEEVERVIGSDDPAHDAVKGAKTFDKIRTGRQNS
jgi:hypothetical protein